MTWLYEALGVEEDKIRCAAAAAQNAKGVSGEAAACRRVVPFECVLELMEKVAGNASPKEAEGGLNSFVNRERYKIIYNVICGNRVLRAYYSDEVIGKIAKLCSEKIVCKVPAEKWKDTKSVARRIATAV